MVPVRVTLGADICRHLRDLGWVKDQKSRRVAPAFLSRLFYVIIIRSSWRRILLYAGRWSSGVVTFFWLFVFFLNFIIRLRAYLVRYLCTAIGDCRPQGRSQRLRPTVRYLCTAIGDCPPQGRSQRLRPTVIIFWLWKTPGNMGFFFHKRCATSAL